VERSDREGRKVVYVEVRERESVDGCQEWEGLGEYHDINTCQERIWKVAETKYPKKSANISQEVTYSSVADKWHTVARPQRVDNTLSDQTNSRLCFGHYFTFLHLFGCVSHH
jgi:hypothetical protein